MNNNNPYTTGAVLLISLCCVWPVIVHIILLNAGKFFRNFRWESLIPKFMRRFQ
jgi:hypothetical protein